MGKGKQCILIDITHIAQFNFYINFIKILAQRYFIYITIIERGKLPQIVNNDLKGIDNIQIQTLGRHIGGNLSAIIEANLIRIIKLFFFCLDKRILISFSNGFQTSLIGTLLGFPSITFGDDPRSLDYNIKLLFSSKVYFCLFNRKFAQLSRKAHVLRCVKEWAYLNPNVFNPNPNALLAYSLIPKKYLIVREVSTKTINYSKQKDGLIENIKQYLPKDYKIVLSLEDKSQRHLYPSEWDLLEEPLRDIHSLIYFSRAMVSSGDSMAREAAVLGVPGIYVGARDMFANSVLESLSCFYQYKEGDFKQFIDNVLSENEIEKQEIFRQKLNTEFIDMNKFCISITNRILK